MPIRLQRTNDLALVRSIITQPKLYSHITHDYAPAREDFWPNPDPAIHYMIVYDQEIMALVTAHSIISPVLWQAHHAILPQFLSRSDEIGEAFTNWLFTETPCQTIIAFSPANNRLGLRYAERQGMHQVGVIPKVYPKGGVLHDMLVLLKPKPPTT